ADAFFSGRNTFVEPLSLDWVAAAGGDVSYGYVNAPSAQGAPQSVVNAPIITSAATAFLAAGVNCLYDKSDDATCDAKQRYAYERYFLVGDGDVASIAEEVYAIRGTPTGTISGVVSFASTGQPAPNARVMLFADPDPTATFATIDELAEANARARGDVGL